MREVEYRIWDFTEKEMLSEYDLDNRIVESGEDGYFHFMKVARYQPLQYTGLVDIHGKKVFDRDVLRVTTDFDLRKQVLVAPIQWSPVYVSYICDDWLGHELLQKEITFEVIGNIYEHPELTSQVM